MLWGPGTTPTLLSVLSPLRVQLPILANTSSLGTTMRLLTAAILRKVLMASLFLASCEGQSIPDLTLHNVRPEWGCKQTQEKYLMGSYCQGAAVSSDFSWD